MTISDFNLGSVVSKMFAVMDGVADGTMPVESAEQIRGAGVVIVKAQEVEIHRHLAAHKMRALAGGANGMPAIPAPVDPIVEAA